MSEERSHLSDARSAERAFSRAVITSKGRVVPGVVEFDAQVRDVCAKLEAIIRAAVWPASQIRAVGGAATPVTTAQARPR